MIGRRCWLWIAVAAGCSFRPQGLPGDPDASPDDGPPGDTGGPIDARTDGGPIDARTDGMPALCPAGYAPINGSTTRYRVVTTTAPWDVAEDDCNDDDDGDTYLHSTHLVVVGNDAERLLITQGNPAPLSGNSWVGLSDEETEGQFRWVTNEPTLGYPVVGQQPPWDGGDPDGAEAENCVRFKNSFDFEDKPCTDSLRYTCECDPFPPRDD